MWVWLWAGFVAVVVVLLGWGCWSEWRATRRVERIPVDVAVEVAETGPVQPLWNSLPTAEYPPVPVTRRGVVWQSTDPPEPVAEAVERVAALYDVPAELLTDPPAAPQPLANPARPRDPEPTLGEQGLFDPYAVLQLGAREVHRGCLAARRDGKPPCAACAPVLTGSADSPLWRGPR